MKRFFTFIIVLFLTQAQVFAYPEFYEYSRKVSNRKTNCALCHSHGDGPEGLEPGQIGSLNKDEMEKLMRARSTFNLGSKVESPILNSFGNQIIFTLGKKKFLELKTHPQDLARELGLKSDLDSDGIPDSVEYLDGTLAISPEDGHPWKLFVSNLQKYFKHILLAIVSVSLLLYGFINFLKGLDLAAKVKGDNHETKKH